MLSVRPVPSRGGLVPERLLAPKMGWLKLSSTSVAMGMSKPWKLPLPCGGGRC